MEEIGSCQAIVSGISTKADGSIKLVLELNPSEQVIVNKLMNKWSVNKRLVQVGIISIDESDANIEGLYA